MLGVEVIAQVILGLLLVATCQALWDKARLPDCTWGGFVLGPFSISYYFEVNRDSN